MEEKNLIINENKTPFSVFEKRIDYTLVKDPKKQYRNRMKKLLSRVAIGFCSLLLLVGGVIGVYEINEYNKRKTCPFEVGTYYYSESTGNYDSGIFDESSYIVITEEETNGLGSFEIENKNKDWVIYGEFYLCNLTNFNHMYFVYEQKSKIEYYTIVPTTINNTVILQIKTIEGQQTVKFTLRTE